MGDCPECSLVCLLLGVGRTHARVSVSQGHSIRSSAPAARLDRTARGAALHHGPSAAPHHSPHPEPVLLWMGHRGRLWPSSTSPRIFMCLSRLYGRLQCRASSWGPLGGLARWSCGSQARSDQRLCARAPLCRGDDRRLDGAESGDDQLGGFHARRRRQDAGRGAGWTLDAWRPRRSRWWAASSPRWERSRP